MEKFKEYKREFTDEEMILHAWDKEMIQDLMSRFVLMWGNGDTDAAIDTLWVKEPEHTADASFGTNTGFFVGLDEVRRHLTAEALAVKEATLAQFRQADAAYASAQAGLGITSMHSATTPLLFISADDKYARYLCYDLGMNGNGAPDGTAECYFEFALLLVELVREADGFKIWHMVEQHDFSIPSGINYNDFNTVLGDKDPVFRLCGTPTIEKEVYDNQFGWEYLFYDMPRPFKTYDEDEGYGPMGKIGRKFYERIEML